MNIPTIHEAFLPLKKKKDSNPIKCLGFHQFIGNTEKNILNNIIGIKTAKSRLWETTGQTTRNMIGHLGNDSLTLLKLTKERDRKSDWRGTHDRSLKASFNMENVACNLS